MVPTYLSRMLLFGLVSLLTAGTAYSSGFGVASTKYDDGYSHGYYMRKHIQADLVLDSADHFISSGADWEFESRYRVLTRDKYGQPLTGASEFFKNGNWFNKYRDFYAYLKNGYRDTYLKQVWNSQQQSWEDCFYVKYCGTGYSELFDKTWNYEDNKFMDGIRNTYALNDEDLQEQYLRQNWDTVGESWQSHFRYFYTYNQNGDPDTIIKQIWQGESKGWLNNRRDVNNYLNPGRLSQKMIQYWVPGKGWWDRYKVTNYYNNKGYLVSAITMEWNSGNSRWELLQRNYRSYDRRGNLLTLIVQNRDNERWVNFTLEEFNYDRRKNIIYKCKSVWDEDNESWVGDYRIFYSYNRHGSRTYFNDQEWDSARNAWINVSKEVSVYDKKGNNILYYSMEWDTENDQWQKTEKSVSYYSKRKKGKGYGLFCETAMNQKKSSDLNGMEHETTISGRFDSALKVTVYPNPTHDKINLTIDGNTYETLTLRIFTANGRLLEIKKINGPETSISMGAYPAGWYIINIDDKIMRKVLVQ